MELLENPEKVRRTPVNLKREILKYLKKWPWFLLSMILFYAAARLYLRYTQPQYLSKTSLKLQESKSNNTAVLSDLKNLGMGISGDTEMQGETTVILSKPLLAEVAKELNLQVSFFSVGKIKEQELYGDSPLTGRILSLNDPDRFSGGTFMLTPVGNNSYRLQENGKVFRFNAPADLPFGKIQIDIRPGVKLSSQVQVVFRSLRQAVGRLESSLNVTLPPNKGLLMEVSMVGPLPRKSEDILNELTRQYIANGIKDKNREAQYTQDFINDRLAIITDDLSGIEGEKEKYKRENQITDLQAQAGIALNTAEENTKIILDKSMQLDLINSVLSASANGQQLLPTGLGLPAGAETSIGEYNNLVLTRNRVLKQATTENPAVVELSKQISAQKNLIRQNLLEARETLQLQLAQARGQLNTAKGNISKFPTQEKMFRSIDRQQTLKEQLYLYLLQKREENAITLAVTAPKAQVVDPAFTTGQVKPNGQQIILGALAAGFLLPLLGFVGWFMLDTRVHSKQDLAAVLPESPVIGEIPLIDVPEDTVKQNSFTYYAESFRILASNLKYLLKAAESGSNGGSVILVTSSIKGEGKTTVSINLAHALAGQSKTLLIGADIRDPRLQRLMSGSTRGLTDFLISDDEDPAGYIATSETREHLDVLFSGNAAPNPADLLEMKKLRQLIEKVRNRYDYIIMDSAPVMLVSDTLHLLNQADVVLFTFRAEYTEKEMLNFAAEFRTDHDIKKMGLVLNGIKPEYTVYGKPYGYGYFSDSQPDKPWWKLWT